MNARAREKVHEVFVQLGRTCRGGGWHPHTRECDAWTKAIETVVDERVKGEREAGDERERMRESA